MKIRKQKLQELLEAAGVDEATAKKLHQANGTAESGRGHGTPAEARKVTSAI